MKIPHTENEVALLELLDEALEYLIELQHEWCWKQNGGGTRNDRQFAELSNFIARVSAKVKPLRPRTRKP